MTRIRNLLVLTIGTVLLAAGCGSSGDDGGGASGGTTTIKVAYTTGLLGYIPVAAGIAEGYYKDEGLKLEESTFKSGGDVTAALLAGGVDVGATGIDRPITLLAQNKPPLQNFVGLQVTPVFTLVAPPDSDLPAGDVKETMHALKGKKIGIAGLGGAADLSLTALLNEAGMTKNDVVIIEVGLGSTAIAALKQGSLDASLTLEPDLSQVEQLGLGKVLLDLRDASQVGENISLVPNAAVIAKPDWLDKNKDTATKFAKATSKGLKFVQENKDATVDIMVSAYGLKPDIAAKVYDAEIGSFGTQISEEAYNALTTVMKSAKVIDTAPAYDKAVATQFADTWAPAKK